MKLRLDRSAAALTAAIVLAYAGAAEAQQQGTAQRDAATTTGNQVSAQNRSPSNAQAAARSVRASEMIGMDVRNTKGERIGDVNDLIVDITSGRVMYAVVGIGGFLGIGEKVSALPMNQVKLMQTGATTGTAGDAASRTGDAAGRTAGAVGRAVDNDGVKGDRGPIGSDRTRAEAQQQGRAGVLDNDGVRGDKGGIGSDRSVATERSTDRAAMNQARNESGTTSGNANGRLSGRSAGGMHVVVDADVQKLKNAPNFDRSAWPDLDDAKWRTNVDDRATGGARGGQLVRASQLMDADVKDAQGKEVGEIEDLVVDVRDGRVLTAVIDFDQAWTPNDKLVAVPLRALRSQKGNEDLTFAGDKASIERAPSFDKGRWPDLNQGRFRSDVERFSTSWRGESAQAPGAGTTGTATERSRAAAAATGAATGSTTTGAQR